MSEEPILPDAKEIKADYDSMIDNSKQTEDETSTEENDPLKDSKNANSVESKQCIPIKIEADSDNDFAKVSAGNVTRSTPSQNSQSLFPDSEITIELQARKLRHNVKKEFNDEIDINEDSTGNVTKITPSSPSERKTDESRNQKSRTPLPEEDEAIELEARKLWHDMKIEFNDTNDIAEVSTGNVTKNPSSLSRKTNTKKSTDPKSKRFLPGSTKTIESESHKLYDNIKIEVDDNNDIADFSTRNVAKISPSLLSKRKTNISPNQKSLSLVFESQTHKLFDDIKKGVDKMFERSSERPLLKKTNRTTKPRPKKRCDICDKIFADSSSYAKHQRIHSDKKPFTCDQCQKSFRQSNDLKRHIRTHENNLEFSCDQCPSRFNCPFNLKRHKVVHAQEKPFKCQLCSSSFTRLNDMKTHTMLHVKKDLFKCQLCNMTFSRPSNLKRHLSMHAFKEKR